MRSTCLTIAAAVAVTCAAFGCRHRDATSSDPLGATASAPGSTVAQELAPITAAELDAAGAALATTLRGCSTAEVERLIAEGRLLEVARATSDFMTSAMRSGSTPPATWVCDGVHGDFPVRYVGVVETEGQRRPRVEAVFSDQLHRFEPILARGPDNSVTTVDLYWRVSVLPADR
jgi:hypothetical protein